ncbi:MAG: LLM class flavin-dependent oxidoreductase [Anaerolineae bacterium]|nr:LLM class flavin-dependent oxidoreductase [Anaerolineae bacterium]
MQYGVSLPLFDQFADPHLIVDLARRAENAGWDGVFLWDHLIREVDLPVADPWILLAAIATRTTRVKLGTMITPLARRRPWKLARETVTLDHLSNGRLILGVGLGSRPDLEHEAFGDPGDDKIRAQLLDEGLDILNGLWSGQPFRYDGQHYHLDDMTFLPRPVQQPRIPIWIAGYWPNKPPLRRAARWDGTCAERRKPDRITPDQWRDLLAYIRDHRESDALFDAVHSDSSPADDPAAAADRAAAYADAGVTWWMEYISPYEFGVARDQRWPDSVVTQMIHRLEQGPPRL